MGLVFLLPENYCIEIIVQSLSILSGMSKKDFSASF